MPPKREILMIGTFIKTKNNSKVNLYLTETHLLMISVWHLNKKTAKRVKEPVESAKSLSTFECHSNKNILKILHHYIKLPSKEKKQIQSNLELKMAFNGLKFWNLGSLLPITHFFTTSINQLEKEVSQLSKLNIIYYSIGLYCKEKSGLIIICCKSII